MTRVFRETIELLSNRLKEDLPGESAHSMMAPAHRKSRLAYLETATNIRTGCVMAVFYPDITTHLPRLILIERAAGDISHPGQIGFPGGKLEKSDADKVSAALRETQEETGVPSDRITVIGELSTLYIPVSNFMVHPYIGWIETEPEFYPAPSEVENILTPFFYELTDPANIKTGEFAGSIDKSVNAPYYEASGYRIWGATAMIISEIAYLLK